jgi:hypothetical protein
VGVEKKSQAFARVLHTLNAERLLILEAFSYFVSIYRLPFDGGISAMRRLPGFRCLSLSHFGRFPIKERGEWLRVVLHSKGRHWVFHGII